jgi:hypothetical protein
MKQGSKLTKKEPPKSDNANSKESANNESSSGETTPDVMARSRRSLTGISEGNEEEKDQQIEMMELYVMQQQRELEGIPHLCPQHLFSCAPPHFSSLFIGPPFWLLPFRK